jgi:hypothetical protein
VQTSKKTWQVFVLLWICPCVDTFMDTHNILHSKSQRPVSCTSILRPWWFSLNIYYFAKYKNWDRTQPWWYGAYICDFQISAVSLQKANVDWENRNQSIWLLISDLFSIIRDMIGEWSIKMIIKAIKSVWKSDLSLLCVSYRNISEHKHDDTMDPDTNILVQFDFGDWCLVWHW